MTSESNYERELFRLRLAARVLIEWQTPPADPYYQQVLKGLLKVHPFASHAGLTTTHMLLKLDEMGIVLFYLSGTLDISFGASVYTQWIKREVIRLIWERHWRDKTRKFLTEEAVIENDREAWNGGPTASQLASAVLFAFNMEITEMKKQVAGAILIKELPFDVSEKDRRYAAFIAATKAVSNMMQDLATLIRKINRTLIYMQAFIGITLSTIILLADWAPSDFKRWVDHVLSKVGLFEGYNSKIFIIIILIFSVIPLLKSYRNAVSRLVSKVIVRSKNKQLRIDDLIKESGDLTLNYLLVQLGKDPALFKELMAYEVVPTSSSTYSDYLHILHDVRRASKDVIDAALQCLINPDIPSPAKQAIFGWLCHVEIDLLHG